MADTRTLQTRYVSLDVTTPAGTLQAAPQSTAWSLGRVFVEAVRVRIPPGHMGLVGIAVLYSGVPIIPSEQLNTFWVGNDEEWPLDVGWEISGPFTIVTYNTDIYDHTIYLRARIRDLALLGAQSPPPAVLNVSALPGGTVPSDSDLDQAISDGGGVEPSEEPPASLPGPEEPIL